MTLLKGAVFAVVLWFVWSTLSKAVDELQRSDWRLDPQSLALSGGIYLAGLLPAGWFWWWLLRRLHQPVRFWTAIKGYFVGHLGKYVPGKAIVVVLRVGAVRHQATSGAVATLAVMVETLTMMACGALVALILVAAMFPPDWKLLLAGGLALATGGPTLPPLFNRFLRPLSPSSDSTSQVPASYSLDWRSTFTGWAAMAVLWGLLGLSLNSVLTGLAPGVASPVELWLVATAAVALSTVAGFLSLLPGGLVVRELLLLELLAPQIGESTALVAAVLLRLVWLVSELAVSVILYIVVRD